MPTSYPKSASSCTLNHERRSPRWARLPNVVHDLRADLLLDAVVREQAAVRQRSEAQSLVQRLTRVLPHPGPLAEDLVRATLDGAPDDAVVAALERAHPELDIAARGVALQQAARELRALPELAPLYRS